jgi:hypothetical protein
MVDTTLAHCTFRNFDITISHPVPPYSVTALYQGRSATSTLDQDSTQSSWPQWLDQLGEIFVPEETLTRVGTHLYRALFQGEVGRLWQDAQAVLAEAEGVRLRLRLTIHPPQVAALPWESLRDPRSNRILAISDRITLLRTANQRDYLLGVRLPKRRTPLTILLLAVETPDGLAVHQEADGIETMLAPFTPQQIRLIRAEGRLDLHHLRRLLQEHQPDVLHIMGHGEADGLLLWREERPHLYTGSQVQAALEQNESLRLVLLNACLAGKPDSQRPFSSVAQRLMQIGLPAVIAMQFSIEDQTAIHFASFVYEALLKGNCPGFVDSAVSAARSNLYIHDPNQVGYITPVLWLNGADGQILALDAPAQRAVEEATESIQLTLPPPPLRELGVTEKRAWLDALPPSIPYLNLRYASLVQEARASLDRLHSLDQAQRQGQPAPAKVAQDLLETFGRLRTQIDNLANIRNDLG